MILETPHKIFFWIVVLILTGERIQNTFAARQRSPEKNIRVFEECLFWPLVGTYLGVVLIDLAQVTLFIFEVHRSWIILGSTLYVAGVALRRSAIHALGDLWSLRLVVKENHRRIRSGIYRFMEHPYYCAVLFELVGFSILCHSLPGLGVTLFVQLPMLWMRMHYESRMLCLYEQRIKGKS